MRLNTIWKIYLQSFAAETAVGQPRIETEAKTSEMTAKEPQWFCFIFFQDFSLELDSQVS